MRRITAAALAVLAGGARQEVSRGCQTVSDEQAWTALSALGRHEQPTQKVRQEPPTIVSETVGYYISFILSQSGVQNEQRRSDDPYVIHGK
jgi:hypothetical protein